jgi:hypothetical protein
MYLMVLHAHAAKDLLCSLPRVWQYIPLWQDEVMQQSEDVIQQPICCLVPCLQVQEQQNC